MSVHIQQVATEEQLDLFVNLPFDLLGGEPLWVPGLKKDDRALLTPGKHPFWETAERELFLAFRGDRPVGRIAAVFDRKANAHSGEACGAFGFFDCAPDGEAAQALFDAARTWLAGRGAAFMRGPLNPSTNYTCGLLVDGFDVPPGLMMPWNPPHYVDLLNGCGFRKEQDLYAYHIYRDGLSVSPRIAGELARVKERGDFVCRKTSRRTMADDVRAMLGIYSESWSRNFAFSPLSPAEAEVLVKELTSYLDPRFFVLFFHNDEPAGGMVALPDFNPMLKRLNGSLGILAPWHFLRTGRERRRSCRIMLFGIRERYRLLGLPLLLFDYMLEQAKKSPDFEWVEGSWVLEDNVAVDDLIEDFGGKLVKRYRIFRKDIMGRS